jgi:general secretion pathway protein K
VIVRNSRQTGMALLAALILVMSVVIIMGNIFYRHQINIAQTALSLHQDQASLLALGAESWARQLLDDDDKAYDGFDETWAQAIPALPVEGGLLNGCISDLQGKLNLNNFATITSLSTSLRGSKATLPKIWHFLLNLQEIPIIPGRVAAIVDWVDKNSTLIDVDGAEIEEYAGLMPPRIIADEHMVEPSELASVMGYEIFEVQKLMPWITALPIQTSTGNKYKPTTININTASEELLLALGGDTYAQQFRDFVIAERPFDNMNNFYKQLKDELAISQSDAKLFWPDTLVDIKSDYFQLYMEVILGEARIEVNSIIHRSTKKSVIISRNLTTVPVSVEKSSASVLFEKIASKANMQSEDDLEEMIDNQQIQPACLMIGA